jgi:hypothetical protein
MVFMWLTAYAIPTNPNPVLCACPTILKLPVVVMDIIDSLLVTSGMIMIIGKLSNQILRLCISLQNRGSQVTSCLPVNSGVPRDLTVD